VNDVQRLHSHVLLSTLSTSNQTLK
jgi:hypothetical protein